MLADQTTIAIERDGTTVRGCQTQERIMVDESSWVPDFAGCLAVVLANDEGLASHVRLLDPLRSETDRWGLTAEPTSAEDGELAIRFLFGDRHGILSFDETDGSIAQTATARRTHCAEGLDGAAPAFSVDQHGTIIEFLGYGDADGPGSSPCSYVI